MMQPLANKGTRLTIAWFIGVFVTLAYGVNVVAPLANLPTFDQWFSAIQWTFGIYALSEVGGKGAEAYRDKSDGYTT